MDYDDRIQVCAEILRRTSRVIADSGASLTASRRCIADAQEAIRRTRNQLGALEPQDGIPAPGPAASAGRRDSETAQRG
jgi:hypothetical protein